MCRWYLDPPTLSPANPPHLSLSAASGAHVSADPLQQTMNSFLYMLEGKAAIGDGQGDKDQIDAHNTVTLTKVQQ